jgi:hypothetical protein
MPPSTKTLPLRLDPETYQRLFLQAKAEGISMNELVKRALGEHFEAKPIDRERLRALASEIVARDAALLDALAKA